LEDHGGDFLLPISTRISWRGFPTDAAELARLLGSRSDERKVDAGKIAVVSAAAGRGLRRPRPARPQELREIVRRSALRSPSKA